jgi:tight adherence protein C
MIESYLLILVYLFILFLLYINFKMLFLYRKSRSYICHSAEAKNKSSMSRSIVWALNCLSEKVGKCMIRILKIKNLKKYSEFIEYYNFQNLQKLNEQMIIGYKYMMSIFILMISIIFFSKNNLGLLISFPIGFLGFFIPDMLIKRIDLVKIKKIEKEIPYIIDLLYISTLSGQNIYRSIKTLTKNYISPLCFEFERFLKDIDMGLGKNNAYENMLKRNRSKEFRSLLILLMQTERHGCKVSDLLKQKSKFVKFKNLDVLNKKIKTTNLKMLFPIIFLILPSFILLVCGPVFYLIGGNIFFGK